MDGKLIGAPRRGAGAARHHPYAGATRCAVRHFGLTDAPQQSVNAGGGRDKHLIEISEPCNIDTKLKVRGLELTWQQPLDMLPVKGFGLAGGNWP